MAAVAVLCGGALASGAGGWTGPGPGGIPVEELVPRVVRIRIAGHVPAHGGRHAGRARAPGAAVDPGGRARLTGQDRRLRAGLFELRPGLSPRELLAARTRARRVGPRHHPRGTDAEETATLLADALGFAPEDFLAAADLAARREIIAWKFLRRRGSGGLVRQPAGAGDPGPGASSTGAKATWRPTPTSSPRTPTRDRGRPRLVTAVGAARLGAGGPALPGPGRACPAPDADARLDHRGGDPPAPTSGRVIAAVSTSTGCGWTGAWRPTRRWPSRCGKKGQRILLRDLESDSAFNTYRRRGPAAGADRQPGRGVPGGGGAAGHDLSRHVLRRRRDRRPRLLADGGGARGGRRTVPARAGRGHGCRCRNPTRPPQR